MLILQFIDYSRSGLIDSQFAWLIFVGVSTLSISNHILNSVGGSRILGMIPITNWRTCSSLQAVTTRNKW